MARIPPPPPFGIFTFSSSVQDGATIEKKDTGSYKAEQNEISFSDCREKKNSRLHPMSSPGSRCISYKFTEGFAALRDSNSYRLPPAAQSVLLQWTLPLQAEVFVLLISLFIVFVPAWQDRETLSVANLWPSMGLVLVPRNPVVLFYCLL